MKLAYNVYAKAVGTNDIWLLVATFRLEQDAINFVKNDDSGGAYNFRIKES